MSIILAHPAAAPTTTVTLPNPELNDVERPTYGNVIAYNRTGGILNAVADHPTPRTREYRIRKLTSALRTAVQTFLRATAGDVIKVTDYNSVEYDALVTNENIEYIATGPSDCNGEFVLQLMEL